MNAIMVSVDYSDLLRITLPYNRHHFDRVMVVTTPGSSDGAVAKQCGGEVFETDSFYADSATFNKFRALEEGLDSLGRDGWLCIMDADVLWPKSASKSLWWERRFEEPIVLPMLYTPMRRMWEEWPKLPPLFKEVDGVFVKSGGFMRERADWVPLESEWHKFPLHRQQQEFAGYSQIFHCSDGVLGPPPWHEINWTTAGAADSWFQQKWPDDRKIRPPFECLHLGPAGINWFGRATMRADGTVPEETAKRKDMTRLLWARRAELRRRGLDPFQDEKIKETK